jgi:hypothetical protein
MSQRLLPVGRRLPPAVESVYSGPDWAQASPSRIRSALQHASGLPCGGWYAVDVSRRIAPGPTRYQVAGHPLVAFRDATGVVFGPDECPHLGASLSTGKLCEGKLVCPWHGLALGRGKHGAWRPLRCYDDGVLTWVRLDALHEGALSERPLLAARPRQFIEGSVRLEARCDPVDVIANRLDPWHGAHFHPKAFADLRVTHATDESLTLRVAYRVLGPLVIEVDARFHCPDPRTIVMTIVAGEGAGSVVETHATPIAPGRTLILETTLASSERAGFRIARGIGAALRPFIEWSAMGLWRDDAAYAERTYGLRTGAIASSIPLELPSAQLATPRHKDGARHLLVL